MITVKIVGFKNGRKQVLLDYNTGNIQHVKDISEMSQQSFAHRTGLKDCYDLSIEAWKNEKKVAQFSFAN